MVATGCDDASTAAAVQDALCGSIAITTRSGVFDIAGTKLLSSPRLRDRKRGGHTNFRLCRPLFSHSTPGAPTRGASRLGANPDYGRQVWGGRSRIGAR